MKPTAYIWTLPEMIKHLIFVREGRRVLGRTLLSTAEFKGLTEASRMLVDDDKTMAVSKLWLMEPGRISVDTVKEAWALREIMPDCPPWIEWRTSKEDGL